MSDVSTSSPSAPGLPPSLSPARAWAVTLVATATMAISYLDRQVLAVLAPTITSELQISDQAYGWLASAFSIAYLISAPFAGRALERVGVRGGMVIAVLVWTAVSASHAFALSFAMLFVMRLALGVAESPSFPGSTAAIARTLPPETRARGLGVLYTGSSFGAMVAPPLAAALVVWLGGWRFAFVGVAIIGLVWVPLWLAATSPREVRALLDAAPSASAPRASMLDTARHPGVLRACALVLAASPIFAFILLWGAKILRDEHHVAQEDVGDYLWLPPLCFDLGSIAFGIAASRYARRHGADRSPIALATVALMLALVLAALPLCSEPWPIVAVLGIAMAGGGGLFAILTADMIARVGASRAASAGGITAAAQSLAYIVASPMIGAAVDRTHAYGPIASAIAAWLVPGAVIWMITRRAGLADPRLRTGHPS